MKNVFTKQWFVSAIVRCIKTMAQSGISMLTAEQLGVLSVDWIGVASVVAMAGIISILTSLAGLPECKVGDSE